MHEGDPTNNDLLTGLSRLYIDGEYVEASYDEEPVIDPGNEEIVGYAPVADQLHLTTAVAAARHAFDHGPWPRYSPQERAQVLMRFHAALAGQRDRLAHILIREAGVIRADVWSRQINIPLKHLANNINIALQDFSRQVCPEVVTAGKRKAIGSALVQRVPVGVVAAVSAYNYPTYLNLAKIGPALMAGNTMILKPSPMTPFQAILLGQIASEAGLPRGVLNIVNGGAEVGQFLCADSGVDLISFTGSEQVGKIIAENAGRNLKRCLLELGGKSPLIVRSDANLDAAAAMILRGFTSHAGQGCAMFTRAIVHNSIKKNVVDRISEMARSIEIGPPGASSTGMGPVISAQQRQRVEAFVQRASEEQSPPVFGGSRPTHLTKGFFFEPTLFDNVDNRSEIAQEEVFGPVGVVVGFDDDEEAISLANDSKYGLRAGVISSDSGKAFEMAQCLNAGQVLLNGGALTSLSDSPFGGLKQSGVGRENGREGFLCYTEVRSIEYHA